jgi:outer membrane protein assembly factor BamB
MTTLRLPALLSLLLAAAGLDAAAPAPVPLTVIRSVTGPDAAGVSTTELEGFLASLAARPGFAAQPARLADAAWSTPPRADGLRVSLVAVAVRDHRDLVALVWDDAGTTALATARRPCRQSAQGARRDWIDPGPGQIVINAVKELAADVGHACQPQLAPREDRRVQVTIRPWADAAAATTRIDSIADGEEPVPLEPATEATLDGGLALTFAAVGAAGFQPTTGPAPATLEIELAGATDRFAFRCTLVRDGRTTRSVQDSVPLDGLCDDLAVACRRLLVWQAAVRDAVRLGRGPVVPLAAAGGFVVVAVDGGLRSIDAATGRDRWTIPAEPKAKSRFAAIPSRTQAADEATVLRLGPGTDAVDLVAGTFTKLAPIVPASVSACDVAGVRCCMLAPDGPTLFASGQKAWQAAVPAPVTAGPALLADGLVVGCESGAIVAFTADGRERWRRETTSTPRGPIAVFDDQVVLGSREGLITCLDAADGRVAWTHAAGDIPLAPACLVPGGLLIADKSNAIRLLDPATGAIRGTYVAPSWLRHVAVVRRGDSTWVACADHRGVIRFLGLPALAPVAEIALATRPSGLAAAATMPAAWGDDAGPGDSSPALVAGSEDGWLYVLDLPR